MAKRGTVVRDIDHGWAAFQATVHTLARQRPRVVTGITGERGGALHAGSKRNDSVADIARKNEFGIGCAQRSFLRSNFDEKRDSYQRYLVNGMRREVVNVAKTNAQIDAYSSVTLKRLGLKVEGDIKRKIKGHIAPPNTPSTIKSKGSSTPLVATAQMIGALASETRKAGA
jgi:hypothetical protein